MPAPIGDHPDRVREEEQARVVDEGAAAPAPTETYRFMRVLLVVMVIVTLDFTKFLDKGNALRYLILVVPFGEALLIRARSRTWLVRRASFGDKILLVLLLFGGVGSVCGRLFLHTSSTALPIFIPMAMAFLYLLTLEQPTEDETRKILQAIAAIGLLYVLLNALANAGLAPTLKASRSYRNADVMYIALGFAALMFGRWRAPLVVLSLLAVFVFVTYPSATAAMVMLVTLVTIFATRPRGSRARFYVTGITVLLVLVVALFGFGKTIQLAGDYFSAVGKQNNTNARLALWEAGIEKFTQSPLFGDAFSGETSITVYRQAGQRAPFHNPYNDDYILFLASGGVFGFLLLTSWIAWVEVTAYRRYRSFLATGDRCHAALTRALLVGFNAWLTAAAFNPLFSGTGRSMSLFAMYGLMMVMGRPSPPPRSSPGLEGAQMRTTTEASPG